MNLSNENVIHIKQDEIEYLQFRRLLEYKDNIIHAFTLGVNNDYRIPLSGSGKSILTNEQIEKNKNSYKKICKSIGIDYNNIVKTNQVHKDVIKDVSYKFNKNAPDFAEEKYSNTDGLVTNNKGFAICATNADCIVLMMYDYKRKAIANVHSGWRGTIQKIAAKTVDKMKELYGSNPKDIVCCISPSIRKCHFEVQNDVKNIFENTFSNLKNVIESKNEKWYIDTVKLNTEMLKEKGLRAENIIDSKICTVCNSNLLHSYRSSNKHNGLEMGIIELV